MAQSTKGRSPKKQKSSGSKHQFGPTVKAKMGLHGEQRGSVKNILITDDEATLRDLLASQLQERGYRCVSLASKADAYKWSLEHRPDLIITDINSPGMDGFQFVRLLKANTSTVKVPVVFLTGVASEATAEEARRLGRTSMSPSRVRWLTSRRWWTGFSSPKLSPGSSDGWCVCPCFFLIKN